MNVRTLNPRTKSISVASCAILGVVPRLAAAAFTPPDSANLEVWLNGGAGVTSDAGGAVSAWADQSGNGNNAAQSTPGDQPTLIPSSGVFNGQPALSFNGSTDFMQAPLPLSSVGGMTVFVVANHNSTNTDRAILGESQGNYGASDQWLLMQSTASSNLAELHRDSATTTAVTNGPLDTADHVYSLTYDGGAETLTQSVDGNASSAQALYTNFSATTLDIGSLIHFGSGFNYGDVNIAEILVYNTALSSTDANAIQTYLDGKYIASGPPQWGPNASGDWNVANNWKTGVVPNGIGAEADFLGSISSNKTIFTDAPVTVGTLRFSNINPYVLTGSSTLTLQVSSGSALVDVQNPTTGAVTPLVQEINLPLTIASDTTFNVAANTTLEIADPITIGAGHTLTKTGPGTVTYLSTITVQSGGVINFASSTAAHSLALVGSALATVPAHVGGTPALLQLDSVSLDTPSKLDLTNNALIVHAGNIPGIVSELKAGFNSGQGYWNGSGGIVSSAAASDSRFLTTLGYRQGTGSAIDGINTAATDVLVKYTYYGDADLSGTVDGADYHQIDIGSSLHLTGWSNGDFNYDGVVDGTDYALIDNTFNQLAATNAGALALIATPTAGLSAVPEPTTLGLMATAAVSLLARRKRRVGNDR